MSTSLREDVQPILVAGEWIVGSAADHFRAENPRTRLPMQIYPITPWADVEAMLEAGLAAYNALEIAGPEAIAAFLERMAERIAARGDEICDMASQETALALRPRLIDVELPRTVDQLRQAAAAARDRQWCLPTVSTSSGISSMYRPLPGVIPVFGPNNFPLAFNSVAGGDAAAALATGHPIIAKCNPLHPATSRMLAEEALAAAQDTADIPTAIVQLLYRIDHDSGARLVSDPRVAASAFTGSRRAGLALKASADVAGKPIYVEMSSINPVVVLPGGVAERGSGIARELATSATSNGGQLCTQPGIVFCVDEGSAGNFARALALAFADTPPQSLLSRNVYEDLEAGVNAMKDAGAKVLAQGAVDSEGWCFPNTLLGTTGKTFLLHPDALQRELFGPASLLVDCADAAELLDCVDQLTGNLTGSVYSARGNQDDDLYGPVAKALSRRVGRLLNDKPPTGVAVVPAMNHGGPFPATGHPAFTAVGMPAGMRRFGLLQSYDNVRDDRLPVELQAANPLALQRFVDGRWTGAAGGPLERQ